MVDITSSLVEIKTTTMGNNYQHSITVWSELNFWILF